MDGPVQTGKLRILQLIGNLEIGGAQEVVRTLATYLQEFGHPVVVCTFKDGPVRPMLEQMGIRVELLPPRQASILGFPAYVRDMLRIRRQLREIVEKYRIDVVQTHLLRTLDFLVVTLRWGNPKLLVFWTVHNSNFALRADQLPGHRWLLTPKRAAHRFLYQFFARWVNGFIAVAEDVRPAILDTIGPVDKKISVISNGVDVRRYQRNGSAPTVRKELGLPQDSRLLTLVATLKHQKGHRVLLEALVPVFKQHPDLHVLLVGDGDLRAEIMEQVNRFDMAANVHLLGNRSDVPHLLSASDYFVLPSLWEGLPMALIEAMAAGLPVIATRVSGTQQVMIADQTGILVEPGDPEGLRGAILECLKDSERSRQMGMAGKKRVEEMYSAQKQTIEHIDLFMQEWRRLIQDVH
jgi:glycosyltransferase involved in cell wall biosynthesis